MFRRLETRGLPGRDSRGPLFWDFRAEPDPSHTPEPGDPPELLWHLSLQAWASGRWRRPEQAEWLADHGFPVPDPSGSVPLPVDVLRRLTDALAPEATVPWSALDARDAAIRSLNAGQAAEALEAAEALMAIAPDWVDARVVQLELLVRHVRDADRAEAVLLDLPEGTLDAAAARRIRQSIAILRDDWDAYAAEMASVMDAGERPWWNFEILGLAYWAGGRLNDAIATFEQGMAEHDNRPDLALRHVEVLAAAERTDDALAAVEALLASDTPPPKALALRGWLRRASAPADAAADYRAALELDPEQAVARVGRGLMRLDAGDLDGARSDLHPFRYSGWQAAWDAWTTFCAATGEAPGAHPADLGHDDACAHADAHDHTHHHNEP
jgi:tetratricopeptide (TPR) repeat protein